MTDFTHTITVTRDGPVARLRFRSDHPANVFTLPMLKEMSARVAEIATAGDTRVLVISGADKTFSFTALHFTDQDLHQAKHLYQLRPRQETVLSLDYAQQGLGNASCGPDQLPQYKIPFKPATLTFTIASYNKK